MTNQLTREQFKIIQEKIKPIFEHLERKKALTLSRALEKRSADLEVTEPELYRNYQKLIAQLKWVACPLIKNDQEFLELIEKYFLEGLELDVNLVDLITAKLELQFGVNLKESINNILSALRKNKQKIGSNPVKIQNEPSLSDPLIKNWLLDFIRSVKTKNPTGIDETNYLFNNQNAKKLSEDNKKILGKILTFYDTFRLYEVGLTAREEMFGSGAPLQSMESISRLPKLTTSVPPPVQPPSQTPIQSPPSLSSDYESKRTIRLREDSYQEPTTGETPSPEQTGPRIEGNIVDLKRQ